VCLKIKTALEPRFQRGRPLTRGHANPSKS
jgi:hypothetical protein